jgi:DNA polymerase-3 subunit beta
MKFSVEKNGLKKMLAFVANVVERRNTIPILANVHMRTEDGYLNLKATDLDVEISGVIPAETDGKHETTVPAQVLSAIVGKLAGSSVAFELEPDGGKITIKAKASKFQLVCLPADDYPDLGGGVMPHKFELPQMEMAKLLEKTRFAISTDETRYYLTGIYLHGVDTPNGLCLRAVATDGHRLARMDVPAPDGIADMPGVILPGKAVRELGKLLTDPNGVVSVELSTSKIRFTIGSVVLTTKLIDGTFPDYMRVIPQTSDKTLVAVKAEFAAALDRVSVLSTTTKGRGVKIETAQGSVTISVENVDAGSATEKLSAEYQGAPLAAGFNAAYLLEIISALDGDHAQFKLTDAAAPMVVQASEDAAALYVLMPMRC